MAANDAKAIGRRIKKLRTEKNLTGADLAAGANISRSYLSELETGPEITSARRRTCSTRVGKALGVSMSELLGRPLILQPPGERRPAGLEEFGRKHRLSQSDLNMLASIKFRGDPPRTAARWEFIYNAIKNSQSMDDRRRR